MAEIKVRDSRGEIVKVFAIVLIVFYHVKRCLDKIYVDPYNTFDPVEVLTNVPLAFGDTGNLIFMFCSVFYGHKLTEIGFKKFFAFLKTSYIYLYIVTLVLALLSIVYSMNLTHINSVPSAIYFIVLPIFSNPFWYVTMYLMYLLIAPFINKALEQIDQLQLRTLCISGILIIASTLFLPERMEFRPYIYLIWMICMTFFSSYIRRYINLEQTKTRGLVVATGIGFLIICSWNYIVMLIPQNSISDYYLRNIVCLIFSTILLVLVQKLKPFHSKVINFLSKQSLGVYIFHNAILIKHFFPIIGPYIQIENNLQYLGNLIAISGVIVIVSFAFTALINAGISQISKLFHRQVVK
jgi:hypothetical protein